MKTKLIFTGIVLALTTACGVTNSKKFNPQSINGVWLKEAVSDHWYIVQNEYLYVNYPYLHGCNTIQINSHAGVLLDSALTKVKLKVAHIKKNNFRIKKINGDIVNSKNTIYEIEADSNHNATGATLTIYEIKNGKESQVSPTYSYWGSSPGSYFQNCLKNAKDTTGIIILN